MPHYTLGQAAKAAGVAKSTISRAIQNGDISNRGNVGNSYRIDPAELQRWIESRPASPVAERSEQRTVTPETERVLREMLDEMRQRIKRAEENADHWREMAEQQRSQIEKQGDQLAASTRLIEDLTRKQSEQPASWWERLRGKSKAA